MRARGRSAVLVGLLLAASAAAQPSRSGCGPTAAGCGPGAARLPGGSVTTTTVPLVGAPPSWVPSMTAAWMLDEASGTRVNAQGTSSRNLTECSAMANNTTQKMEGTASAEVNNTCLATSDAALANLSPPFTCLMWMRYTDGAGGTVHVMENGFTDGFAIDYNTTPLTLAIVTRTAAALDTYTSTLTVAFNTWAHVGIRRTATTSVLFLNGKLEGQKVQPIGAPASGPFHLSSTTNAFFAGEFDEAVCTTVALSDAAVCRVCSCGVRGEQCTCNGAAFTSSGRNATACGSCTLPADCAAATPP